MTNPTTFNLLNDLQRLAEAMQNADPEHRIQWHRVSVDARALLRLVIAENPREAVRA